MKRSISDDEKSQTITFSLKPELFRLMMEKVKHLGYPWTRSAYVANLVINDLMESGLIPNDTSSLLTPNSDESPSTSNPLSSEKKLAIANKKIGGNDEDPYVAQAKIAAENTRNRAEARKSELPVKKLKSDATGSPKGKARVQFGVVTKSKSPLLESIRKSNVE